MQIQLKCSCGEGSCREWAIIELQGVVEVQPGFQDQLQNLEIGRLCRSPQVRMPCSLILRAVGIKEIASRLLAITFG